MKKGYEVLTAGCVLLFLCSPLLAASPAGDVKEGNRLYKQEHYDGALGKYNDAKAEMPDSDIVNYDVGAALFKKGDYQGAVDAFTRALATKDRKLEAGANYNIANSKYRLGNQMAGSDQSGAADLYRQALDYYKRAMELDRNDINAKYNHELVEKELKALLQRKQEQPDQGDKKKDGKDKDQKGKKGSSQEGSGKEKKETKKEENSSAMKQDSQEKTDDKEQEQMKKSGEEGKEKAAGEEGKEKKMSPEEARMLLDAYGADEAMQMKQAVSGRHETVLKDW